MNPLEETQETTVNDVLGFAEDCFAPKVVQEESHGERYTKGSLSGGHGGDEVSN